MKRARCEHRRVSCIIEQPAAGSDLLNYQTFDVGRKQKKKIIKKIKALHIWHETLKPS